MIGFQPFETFQHLAASDDIERANSLLIASCNAFLHRKDPDMDEIEQFEVLAKRLFNIACARTRKNAATILKHSQNLTPLLEKLVIDNIGEDLDDFLIMSEHLSEQSLSSLIAKKNIEISAAIAKRPDLTNPILTGLFQTNSRKVYRALAANEKIPAKGIYLGAFVRSAQLDYQVARLLAKRSDFDSALLAPVFFDLDEQDRIKTIKAFSLRKTPFAPIKKTIEQISVANDELTQALMRLFTENRRPEVANLLAQITGFDDIKCTQIAHDVSGAALFVVLRAFGCTAYDGLKVIIHATSHDEDRSQILSGFAKLFQEVDIDAMAFMMSAWRGEINLLDLTKPEYIKADRSHKHITAIEQEVNKDSSVEKTTKAPRNIDAKSA